MSKKHYNPINFEKHDKPPKYGGIMNLIINFITNFYLTLNAEKSFQI